MERRTYKVVTREAALALGAKTFSSGDHNRYALVAVRGERLDNVIAWGYKSDSLTLRADERNADIAKLAKAMGTADDMLAAIPSDNVEA